MNQADGRSTQQDLNPSRPRASCFRASHFDERALTELPLAAPGGDDYAVSAAEHDDLATLFRKSVVLQRNALLLVKLGGRKLGDEKIAALVAYLDHLLQTPKLKAALSTDGFCLDLELDGNDMTGAGLRDVLDVLARHAVSIRRAKLYKNRIGDAGAFILAASVRNQRRAPEEIHLSHNGLTGRSLIAICMGVAREETHLPCWVRLEHNNIANPLDALTLLDSHGQVNTCLANDRQLCGPRRCAHVANGHGRGGSRSVHLVSIELQDNVVPLIRSELLEELQRWQNASAASNFGEENGQGPAEARASLPDCDNPYFLHGETEEEVEVLSEDSMDSGSESCDEPAQDVGAVLGDRGVVHDQTLDSYEHGPEEAQSQEWPCSYSNTSDNIYTHGIDQLIESAVCGVYQGQATPAEPQSPMAVPSCAAGAQWSPGSVPDWKKVQCEGAINFMPASRPSVAGCMELSVVPQASPAASSARSAPFSAFQKRPVEADKQQDGYAAKLKRLKTVAAEHFSKAASLAKPSLLVSKAASLAKPCVPAAVAFSKAASLGAPPMVTAPYSASTPERKEQALGWGVDVDPKGAGKTLFALLPTPSRHRGPVAESPADSLLQSPVSQVSPGDVVDIADSSEEDDEDEDEEYEQPEHDPYHEEPATAAFASVESVNSLNAAVALAEAALAMAEATYVDGSGSKETAMMAAAQEALGGVELAIAAASESIDGC